VSAPGIQPYYVVYVVRLQQNFTDYEYYPLLTSRNASAARIPPAAWASMGVSGYILNMQQAGRRSVFLSEVSRAFWNGFGFRKSDELTKINLT
jgi:hypothetical protein